MLEEKVWQVRSRRGCADNLVLDYISTRKSKSRVPQRLEGKQKRKVRSIQLASFFVTGLTKTLGRKCALNIC